MKKVLSLFTLLISFCFWSCFSNKNSLKQIDSNPTVLATVTNKVSNIKGENLGNCVNEAPETDIKSGRQLGDFSVDIFEDEKFIGSYSYRKGLLSKEIGFNTETKKKESEIEYFYKKNDKYDFVKINGKNATKNEIFEINKSKQDFLFQVNILNCKSIKLPIAAELLTSEISDLSNIFSVVDNYDDFKKEITTNGSVKTIKFISFNKTSRFHNSPMAMLIGEGDFIKVLNYELTLESNYPSKEIYETDKGKVTKTYSFKDEKCNSVVYQFTDLQNQTNSLEKRFEYHNRQ